MQLAIHMRNFEVFTELQGLNFAKLSGPNNMGYEKTSEPKVVGNVKMYPCIKFVKIRLFSPILDPKFQLPRMPKKKHLEISIGHNVFFVPRFVSNLEMLYLRKFSTTFIK